MGMADGPVDCIQCGVRKPLREMDVVGLGYRCSTCTGKAQVAALSGANDLHHNLSRGERDAMHAAAVKAIPASISVAVLGACLLPFWPSGLGRLSGLPHVMLIGGVVSAILAFGTARYA